MCVTVSLFSRKVGEIRGFLEKYYQKEINMDSDVGQWSYIYYKPLEAIDMISTVIDNNHRHKINLAIQVGDGDVQLVTGENCNDIIKALLHVYYKEECL